MNAVLNVKLYSKQTVFLKTTLQKLLFISKSLQVCVLSPKSTHAQTYCYLSISLSYSCYTDLWQQMAGL